MTDTNEVDNESTEPVESAPEAPQTDPDTTAGTDTTPKDSKPSDDDSQLPEWAREKLSKANKEAANYRTQLREAQDALSKAVTPEQFAEIQSQLAQAQRKSLVSDIASETGVPASLLHGDNEAELREAAQALKDFMSANAQPRATRTPSDPAGGLDPQNNEEPFDAQAYALSLRAGRL